MSIVDEIVVPDIDFSAPYALEYRLDIAPRHQGTVYLLKAEGTARYKIGHSKNPRRRIAEIARQAPYPIKEVCKFWSPVPKLDEDLLHKALLQYRVHGEWFEIPRTFFPDQPNEYKHEDSGAECWFSSLWLKSLASYRVKNVVNIGNTHRITIYESLGNNIKSAYDCKDLTLLKLLATESFFSKTFPQILQCIGNNSSNIIEQLGERSNQWLALRRKADHWFLTGCIKDAKELIQAESKIFMPEVFFEVAKDPFKKYAVERHHIPQPEFYQ